MKRFLLVAVLAMVACDPGSFTAPTISAGGLLPGWMFAYNGRLVRPKPGTYDVYLSPEIAQDAEMSSQADRMLQAVNGLTSASGIVFRRSDRKNSPISFRLDPNDPRVTGNAGWENYASRTTSASRITSVSTRRSTS